MKKSRKLCALFVALCCCAVAALATGTAFAVTLLSQSETGQGSGAVSPVDLVTPIKSENELFLQAFDKKYNDESEMSDASSRKVLRLDADIALGADLLVNRDVNLDLNGHSLDLNGHTLLFRHNYHGAFQLYSAAGTGSILSSAAGARLNVQTPNATVLVDASSIAVQTENLTYTSVWDVLDIASEYVNAALLSGPAGGYYLTGSDIPFVYRYGNYEIYFDYSNFFNVWGEYTLHLNGVSKTYHCGEIKITNKDDAAVRLFDDYFAKYKDTATGEYVVYHSIVLPAGNEYLGVTYEFVGTDCTLSRENNGTVTLDAPKDSTFTLKVSSGGESRNYTVVSRSDSYQSTLASQILKAILSRPKGEEYLFFNSALLTAKMRTGAVDAEDPASYEYDDIFALPASPDQIKLDCFGENYVGLTARYWGLSDVSYELVADAFGVYKLDGTALGMNAVSDREVFENLERISASVKVGMTINGASFTVSFPVGFTWNPDSTITGTDGGGAPESRFGSYLKELQSQLKKNTNQLNTNKTFTMPANFGGAPYLAYRVEFSGVNDILKQDPGILSVTLFSGGKNYSLILSNGVRNVIFVDEQGNMTNDLELLKAEGAYYTFEIKQELLPMNGAAYQIYFDYNFGQKWEEASETSALNLAGVVHSDRYYDANGYFYSYANGKQTLFTSGAKYFSSQALYEYLRGLCSPGETYIQTIDLSNSIAVVLNTAENNIVFDDYRWLALFTGMEKLDLRGRGFSDADLTLLTPLTALQELYIGGNQDAINNSLTSLENLPSLPSLSRLDVSYSYISLFDAVTKSRFPSLSYFDCSNNVIYRSILFGAIKYVDRRYGSFGTQNTETLNDLILNDVTVHKGTTSELSNVEKMLSQIITQQKLVVRSDTAIPMLFSDQSGTIIGSYEEYQNAAVKYYHNGTDYVEYVGDAINELFVGVQEVYDQFPNDNYVTDITKGIAAKQYGFGSLSAEKIVSNGIWGDKTEIISYFPLIRITVDQLEWGADSGVLEEITFKVSYQTLSQPAKYEELVEKEGYSVQHPMRVVYNDGNNSEYQDMAEKFLHIAMVYLDDSYLSTTFETYTLANGAVNNVYEVIDLLQALKGDATTIDGLYEYLVDTNKQDISGATGCSHIVAGDKYQTILNHLNDVYGNTIAKTADRYFDSLTAVIGYIKNTERYNPAWLWKQKSGDNAQWGAGKDGFWHSVKTGNLSSDFYKSSAAYENTIAAVNVGVAIEGYNSLNDAVKYYLTAEKYLIADGYNNASQKYNVSSEPSDPETVETVKTAATQMMTKGVYEWLQYLLKEINEDQAQIRLRKPRLDLEFLGWVWTEDTYSIGVTLSKTLRLPTNAKVQLPADSADLLVSVVYAISSNYDLSQDSDFVTVIMSLPNMLDMLTSTQKITLGEAAYGKLMGLYVRAYAASMCTANADFANIAWTTESADTLSAAIAQYNALFGVKTFTSDYAATTWGEIFASDTAGSYTINGTTQTGSTEKVLLALIDSASAGGFTVGTLKTA